MRTGWRKIWRDLWINKSRTIVVVLAITVGVMAFGGVFTTKDVLIDQMTKQFIAINPSSISLSVEGGYEPELLSWIENHQGVSMARVSASNIVRIFTPQGARNLNLITLDDFENSKVNLITPQSGAWPPQRKELVLERTALKVVDYNIGDSIEVETADGRKKSLDFVGTVHDMQTVPANLYPQLTGYVTFDTLRYLNISDSYNVIDIRTDSSIKNKEEATDLANKIKSELEDRGYANITFRAEKPNKHWGEDPSNAFVTILTIIGSFSLALSVFLVFNTVSAIVIQQKKQIGIMKAVGGQRKEIVVLFLIMTLSYGILALFAAIPLGAVLAYANLKLVANFLNFDIINFYIPLNILLMEAVASLVVPSLAALIPVLTGTKITVREAISDFTTVKKTGGFLERFKYQVSFLSRPLIISLRNTFRQRGRLIMTLVTLTIAGSLFIAVIGNRESMTKELDNILNLYRYDLELYFSQSYDASRVIADTKKVPGVVQMEAPLYAFAEWQKPNETKKTLIIISGVPADTDFSIPTIIKGRMIDSKDTNKIVVSSRLTRDNPELEIGDNLLLKINNQTFNFEIIGTFLLTDQNMAIVNVDYLKAISPDSDQINSIRVRTIDQSDSYISSFAKDFEQQMKQRGYNVAYSLTINTIRSSSQGQFDFMILFLLIMAVLVAVVGGLGLAGTMSLNVLERTREIGVMRSLGASNSAIFKLVVVESMIIGVMSWLIAVPLSVPLGFGFCFAIGIAFFEKMLPFVFPIAGVFIWLGIVIVISFLASIMPAKNAVKLTVRDTLSYE